MEIVKRGDFIELKFTGRANGEIFDSNIDEDLPEEYKKNNKKPLIIILGEKMILPKLEEAIEGKEIGKRYEINISAKDGFGPRHKSLIKTIPLSTFTSQKINPRAGMKLLLDRNLVQIIAVSGARVIVDFNNSLAGKDLHYDFFVVRKIDELSEKIKAFFEGFLNISPKFEIYDNIVLKGPKEMEKIVELIKEKFKKLIGKDLIFVVEEKNNSSDSKEMDTTQQYL